MVSHNIVKPGVGNMNENINLLSMFDENNNMLSDEGTIKVMNLDYINSEITNWEELFKGYSTLYAVTYSSSIDFITKLLPLFEEVEIIFGFEKILKGLDDIMAYQQAALEELQSIFSKKEKELLSRIDDGTLKLFLMRDKISHKKMYLLKGEDLQPKVITGSANLSGVAFSGRQLENIYVLKGEEAYNEFLADIDKRLEELQTDLIQKANSKEAYDNIVNEIYRLRDLRQETLSRNALRQDKRDRIAEMTDFLNMQTGDITEFDDKLVRKLVEKAIVYDDNIVVEFKSGLEIVVNLYGCNKTVLMV
jgi:hypothetical protein